MLVAASERIRDELGWRAEKPELERMVADAWDFMQARPRRLFRLGPASASRAEPSTASAGWEASMARIRSGSAWASSS